MQNWEVNHCLRMIAYRGWAWSLGFCSSFPCPRYNNCNRLLGTPSPCFPLCPCVMCQPQARELKRPSALATALPPLAGWHWGATNAIPQLVPHSHPEKNPSRGRMCGNKNPTPKPPQTLMLHKGKRKMTSHVYWPALSLIYCIAGTTLLQSKES